jgi:hypothetical protein
MRRREFITVVVCQYPEGTRGAGEFAVDVDAGHRSSWRPLDDTWLRSDPRPFVPRLTGWRIRVLHP